MTILQRVSLIAFVILLGAGAVFAAPAAKPGPTELSGIPWAGDLSAGQPKVVYGDDDRIDVYQETDAQRRAWAASTCALVSPDQLVDNGDGTYSLVAYQYSISGYLPCPGEPFAGQPTAAFCTGFMVGPDLIATAGHCVDAASVQNTSFVFGFDMEDVSTPVMTYAPDQIYNGIEVVGWKLGDDADFCIVRVDRPITAAGAQILETRRTGKVALGTNVGVIGHPAGLPTKLAFGGATVVMENDDPGYFITNLDTYGGNSGSPVFNAETGLVEGILVYGENDYVLDGDCFRSNVLENEDGGEGVTKSTTFAQYIPDGAGQILLDKPRYRCEDTIQVSLSDLNLRAMVQAQARFVTDAGDEESAVLMETAVLGVFEGTMAVTAGAPAPGNGVLEVVEGEAIIAIYQDADDGWGEAASSTASASVDCSAPLVHNVAVEQIGGNRACITFETSEPAIGTVRAGLACGEYVLEARGELTTMHRVFLSGMTPETTYYMEAEASDRAENVAINNNEGVCYTLRTTEQADYFTQALFDESPSADLVNTSVTFVPDDSVSMYHACVSEADRFPTDPALGKRFCLLDDDFVRVAVDDGKSVSLYGTAYQDFYVGSNGYVTFGGADNSYEPTLETHFALPRISGYFSDLSPGILSKISVKQTKDRVAVTYDNVRDYWGDRHSFQIEMFFDGVIRITWLKLTYPHGIVGLSAGYGAPFDFQPSDLSAYPVCGSEGEEEAPPPWYGCYAAGSPAENTKGSGVADTLVMLSAAIFGYWWITRRQSASVR